MTTWCTLHTGVCMCVCACFQEQHRLLQVTAHKHGVRLYMLLEADCCRHLCKAVADGSHSAAGCGILRVVVRNKKNVPLGWTLAKKGWNSFEYLCSTRIFGIYQNCELKDNYYRPNCIFEVFIDVCLGRHC